MKRIQSSNQLTRRKFIRTSGIAAWCMSIFPHAALGLGKVNDSSEETILHNPTSITFKAEPVRLKIDFPEISGSIQVRKNGVEIPFQVEKSGNKKYIWVAGDFMPGISQRFEVLNGTPKSFPKKVTLRKESNFFVLENGKVSIRIPAHAGKNIPGPIAGVILADSTWAGQSFWKTNRKLKKYSVSVPGDGTIFGKIKLRYDFEGFVGANKDIPAFAEFEIMLAKDWEHVSIFERHEMGSDEYWEFEMSKGWSPRKGISKHYNDGPGGDSNYVVPAMDRDLVPFKSVSFAPDLFINLIPRWNQHFKDGWAFAAYDGYHQISAVAVKASAWKWPHDNNLQCVVKPEGNYAGVRCSTWRGQRLWWLSASLEPMDTEYIGKHVWENLDKINHDYILDWPGKPVKWWSTNPYDSEQTNPTHTIRQIGKAAVKNAGQPVMHCYFRY